MDLISFLADCTCAGQVIKEDLAKIVKLVYDAIRIGVPVILILVGMFDMGKAITQQKEDEIKKAQGLLVKKAIAAALVFLMLSIVTLVLGVVGGNDQSNVSCIRCLLTGESESTETSGTTGDESDLLPCIEIEGEMTCRGTHSFKMVTADGKCFCKKTER